MRAEGGAIADNENSRINLGVHWKFDATDGKEVGEKVVREVIAAFMSMSLANSNTPMQASKAPRSPFSVRLTSVCGRKLGE
jgi:hypothetical protein